MIAHISHFEKPSKTEQARERRASARRERDLRLCVVTEASGKSTIRYFQSPQDSEGVAIVLTDLEREELAYALSMPGAHFIQRDDRPEWTGGTRC